MRKVERPGDQNRIGVRMPPGWSSEDAGIPDMTVPTPAELEAGYEGDLWVATRTNQRLEVRWRGDHGKYLCRVYLDAAADDEAPTEARTFDYPHEVINWLGLWFQNIGPFTAES